MAAEKILSVMAAKDRLIASQALVMDLAKEVLGSRDVKGAVRTLVHAVYKVVDADHVSLYLVENDVLVCHMAPQCESIGTQLPLGSGIVGRVGKTGETINLEDAYTRPDLFDVSQDLLTEYTTRSVLCLPLRDSDGGVIGVLQAINKHGLEKEPVPFEKHDERSLELLLALTSQQLHFSELIVQRERATRKAESMLALVEAISAEREIVGVAAALGRAAVGLLHCRWALVFLRDLDGSESSGLICHAAVQCATMCNGETGLRVGLDEAVLGEVATSGRPIVLDRETQANELSQLQQRLMPCFGDEIQMEARSALCAPLSDSQTGQVVGVVVAIDRLKALGDVEEQGMAPRTPTPPSPEPPKGKKPRLGNSHRRFSAAHAMGSLLRNATNQVGFNPDAQAGPFCQSDLDAVTVLSHSAANILRTADLYGQEVRFHRQMGALVDVINDARSLAQSGQSSSLISHVSTGGRRVFDCERCTFFTLDNYNQQLVGFYVLSCTDEKAEQQTLHELRVPIKGIVGHVATTRQPLNIEDAWNSEFFNREMDLKTGYRTRTVLCAPVVASNGRLVGVIQCINKIGGRTFGTNDLEMLSMVSISLSDIIQQTLLHNSYDSFIKSNASISSDVKDMFRFYEHGPKKAEPRRESQRTIIERSKRKMSVMITLAASCSKQQRSVERSRSSAAFLTVLEKWDCDISPLAQDDKMLLKSFRLSFERLQLGGTLEVVLDRVGPFLQALKGKYSASVPYHGWRHALSTWHALFLLLDSPAFAGLLPPEEVLALLFAAFGHDVEHPGTSNNFQVNSTSMLALRYNDVSVLENHHAAVTCNILKDQQVVDGLELPVRQRMRQVLLTSILHTDMIKHKDNLAWMETCNVDVPGHRASKTMLDRDVGLKLGSALLHCADLVHPAMPWEVHKQMSNLIAEEFYAQYQEEERLGLPTLPFMGKDPKNLPELAPIQMGFIQFVAKPLWSAMSFIAGKNIMEEVVMNVGDNKDRWKRIADGEDLEEEQPFRMPKQRAPTPCPE